MFGYRPTHVQTYDGQILFLNGGDPFTLRCILGLSTLNMVEYNVELFSSEIRQQHKYNPVEYLKQLCSLVRAGSLLSPRFPNQPTLAFHTPND